MADDDNKMASDNEGIVKEVRDRLRTCIDANDSDRLLALDDLRFLNGEHWTDTERRQRDLDGRPCLTMNNAPAIVHQVTNDVRQNKQSIHVQPVDDKADPEIAEIIEGLCRHIEYDSGADAAYDTALEAAANCGFGFFRLVTEYCNPKSFDQDMKIKRIRNAFTVYVDPNAQEADGSDMLFAIITSKLTKQEFALQYPKAELTQDSMVNGAGDGTWTGPDFVRLAEYYRIEQFPATLVQMSDGSVRLATDKGAPPLGVTPIATRPTLIRRVMWYKITGVEVLESAQVPFDWIPVFPVYGDELDIDGEVKRSGLIRSAKDPMKMYDFFLTSITEEYALRTKTPYIGAVGQFEGMEQDWTDANNRSLAYLEYNPVTVDGNMAPAPQRQPMIDVPSGAFAIAGLMRDNVKAVTGIYDASLGNRSNETSGVAINARKSQGEIGNYHYSDNLSRAIRHLGRCIVSGVPRVYDTKRVLRILGIDGKAKTVEVNKPEVAKGDDGGAVHTVLNDLTVGTYDVVVTSGPAYNTAREEATDAMLQVGQNWPAIYEIAGDKIIGGMGFPGADDIGERIAKKLGISDDDEQQDETMVQTPQGPIPAAQAGQLIGQMNDALEQMQAEMEKLESGIKVAELNAETSVKVAEINAAAKHDDTELKGMIDIVLAKIDAANANVAAMQDTVTKGEEARKAEPKAEKAEPAAVDAVQVMAQLVKAMNPPKNKSMTITAPSGAVYQGQVNESLPEAPQPDMGAMPPQGAPAVPVEPA